MAVTRADGSGRPSPPSRFHAVRFDPERCAGCSLCVRSCPTGAIFVRDGRASIITERCIDCGECVRVCARGAKRAVSDRLSMIRCFRRTVAIPAPALYAQFDETHSVDRVLSGLLKLGFDEVFEVAEAVDLIARATNAILADSGRGSSALSLPLISSACPAVVRIVQLRFPELIPHLVPLIPPMEAAARIVKETMYRGEEGLGVFFITPCAGKVSVTHAPLGYEKSAIDGVIGFKDIYRPLRSAMDASCGAGFPASSANDTAEPQGTATGETIDRNGSMKIEGIADVIDALIDLAGGKLRGIRYIEALACSAGCVGGPLAVENPAVARARLQRREEAAIPRSKRTGTSRQLSPPLWRESLLSPATGS